MNIDNSSGGEVWCRGNMGPVRRHMLQMTTQMRALQCRLETVVPRWAAIFASRSKFPKAASMRAGFNPRTDSLYVTG